ncbi:4-hydroxyphenylpyruvate dioxygenase [Micromonospora sonchi]|uniref:4-hydroxyphenylpyruvate dioxygenase n=1 Tax=Micromonospora sonchi TaxID=1763543 RepID=A0A917TZZ8_9ACTN|nr:4-hydroxyphenylpyruvate dioxygenase [Micromonospora sonchi]GGM47375.1 4-hydroxyphenylpyruvate dioxygenase [Micromonospora sonchi]
MSSFQNLTVDHVRFYTPDIDSMINEFRGYGFGVSAEYDCPGTEYSILLGSGTVRLVLTRPDASDHPGSMYVSQHGFGVADIALETPDAAAAFFEAVRRGARPVVEPVATHGVVTASIAAFGDVLHTFVQRVAGADEFLPGFTPAVGEAAGGIGLRSVDHFAICVEPDEFDHVIEFYERVLDFETIFTERIVVGNQAMNSRVVQSRSGAVTFTVITPDTSRDPGQIDTFLKSHGGAGVQHVAFDTDDVVRSVGGMQAAGVEFLRAPGAYYTLMRKRLEPAGYSVADLRALNVLADEDHDGQLYQIFTRSTHPRGTLFFEVIERVGATTFGSGNIKSLYEAVEVEQKTSGLA